MWQLIHYWGTPKHFFQLAGKLLPFVTVVTVLLLGYGLIAGLLFAPADYQQGNAFRIIYVHVPSASLSLFAYTFMAVNAAIGLIWRIKLAYIAAKSAAIIGASFTLIALITGALWGKPMWGAWWVWDARLTAELVLLFLYLGYIALQNAIPDAVKADKAAGLLALVGVVNIPIIHYSVVWWNTLHQGATITRFGQPTIDASMSYPLFAMMLGAVGLFIVVLLIRMRSEILRREKRSQWVNEVIVHGVY